jgi:predicted PurR-regulated permease PerM
VATETANPVTDPLLAQEDSSLFPGGKSPRRRKSDHVSAVAQTVVAVGVVLVLCYVAKLVLITLLVSILMAFLLEPIVEGLRRVHVPRPLGSFVAVLLMLAVLSGLTYIFYNRAAAFVSELPRYSGNIRQAIANLRKRTEHLEKTTQNVLASDPGAKTLQVEQKVSWAEVLTRSAASVWDFALVVSFIPFLVYFMLSWHHHVRAATVMLFRLENRDLAYKTLGHVAAMIRSFIVGNLLIGLLMSLISMGIFAAVGLPYPYFLGLISGFLSLVPYMGVILAILPPVFAGLGTLTGGQLLGTCIGVAVLHVFGINVLYPKILGRRLQLNPLVVTIALMVWGWIWGGMGLVLAVPITGAMKIIFDHIESMQPYGAWMGE